MKEYKKAKNFDEHSPISLLFNTEESFYKGCLLMISAPSLSYYKITFFSPLDCLYEGDVVFCLVPTEKGDIGVLAHHTPLITSLKQGEIRIYQHTRKTLTNSIEIKGGFMKIKDNFCQIFVI